jgi:hypothetical protein
LLGFTGLVAADVWLEGLTISGGAGNANADGIRCNGDVTAVPKATLRAVTISSNAGSGIEAAASCNLNVTNSTINGNDAGGIVASSSTVTLLGTTLNTNAGGGLFLTSSNFTIVNNFLLGNGNVGATTRGVRIATIASGANPTLFAFNTMVDNLSNGTPRSFSCTDVDKTVTLSGNLVWGIVDEVDVTPAATEPECVHRYSLLAPNVYADGTNNVDITGVTKASVFESIIDPVNFHLKAGSATINKADMAPIAGVPSTDFDGQPRVQGGRADIGADERE